MEHLLLYQTFLKRADVSRADSLDDNDFNMQEHLGSDDEVINKTAWHPLKDAGENVKTHSLVKEGKDRLVFKWSFSSKRFNIATILTGVISILIALFEKPLGLSGSGSPLLGTLVGLLFIGIGVFFLRRPLPKITFDRQLNAMWLGDIGPDKALTMSMVEGYHSLEGLHAVQIIEEYIDETINRNYQRIRSFESYEVNLIFSDGTRINVLDHSDKKAIARDADAIAKLFDVALWNGCHDAKYNWENLGFDLMRWIQILFGLLVVGVTALYLYNTISSSKEETRRLASLSPQEHAKLAKTLSEEILQKSQEGMLSSPYLDTLLRRGAYVDAKDDQGRTPLFYAVMYKNSELIHIFISQGADLDVKDNSGKALLDMLDPLEDQFLYYTIVDAALHREALSRGKFISRIQRKFDAEGKVVEERIEEK